MQNDCKQVAACLWSSYWQALAYVAVPESLRTHAMHADDRQGPFHNSRWGCTGFVIRKNDCKLNLLSSMLPTPGQFHTSTGTYITSQLR